MDERGVFVQKILFIHTVFIYTGCVHFVPFGGRKFDRRNEVLAETGGAVSALTPEVSTLCYVNSETIRSINPARKLCTHYEQFEYETGCKFRPEITVYIYSMNL